jgi:hypothetical protein
MSIEPWVPDESKGEKSISARVPKDLYDYLDDIALTTGCNLTDAIIMELEYAREMRQLSNWFKVSHGTGRMHPEVMKKLIAGLTGNKRYAKKYLRNKRDAENRISPAIIDAGYGAARTVKAFQPMDNGQPDTIANRTTADGSFRPDGVTVGGSRRSSSKIDTAEDRQENSSFDLSRNPAGALKVRKTEEQFEENTLRRAKRRKDNTVMSGRGWTE